MDLAWSGLVAVRDHVTHCGETRASRSVSDLTTSPPTETPSSPLGELDVSLLLSAVWDRGVSRALGGGRVGDVIGRHPPRVPLQALSLIAGGEGPSRRRGGE